MNTNVINCIYNLKMWMKSIRLERVETVLLKPEAASSVTALDLQLDPQGCNGPVLEEGLSAIIIFFCC